MSTKLSGLTQVGGSVTKKLKGDLEAKINKVATDLANKHYDDRYLKLNAKAVDSAKLEGRTKAQVVAEAKDGLALKVHNHNDLYYPKSDADKKYVAKKRIAVGSTSVGLKYFRLLTIGRHDCHASIVYAGVGDYGSNRRGWYQLSISTRNNTIAIDIYSLGKKTSADPLVVYSRDINNVFEVWCRASDYNLDQDIMMLSASGATLLCDSITTTAPTGTTTHADNKIYHSGDKQTWDEIDSKPAQATRWPTFDEVTGRPSVFPPASHNHDILGLVNVNKNIPSKAINLGTTDLNTLDTLAECGFYYQPLNVDALTSRNYPIQAAGSLQVFFATGGVTQTYITYNYGTIYTRAKYSTTWSPWQKSFSTIEKPTWNDINSKPATMPPSAHTHPWSQISGAPVQATRWPTFNEVTDRPSSYAPSAHDHNRILADDNRAVLPNGTGINSVKAIKPYFRGADITGESGYCDFVVLDTYQDATGGKVNAIATSKSTPKVFHFQTNWNAGEWGKAYAFYTEANKPTWNDVQSKPSTMPPSAHTHPWGQISGAPLQATRWPNFSEVTNKPSTFPPSHHTHTLADISETTLQMLPWSASRTYQSGELCTIVENGKLIVMEMYSNQPCKGYSPADMSNRHTGWTDKTKPFWWIPFNSNSTGQAIWWLKDSAPEYGVIEKNVNLPTAVYWRLAQMYPNLVSGNYINTGDIRGVFLRVYDHGSGRDPSHGLLQYQADAVQNVSGHFGIDGGAGVAKVFSGIFNSAGGKGWGAQTTGSGGHYVGFNMANQVRTSHEARPKNVSRMMVICI